MSDGTDRENVSVFIVANLIVKDRDEYHKYEKGFFPLLKKHGGSFVTYDDEHETLEGIAPRTGRMVIFSFPTEEHARQWWADPEYQTLVLTSGDWSPDRSSISSIPVRSLRMCCVAIATARSSSGAARRQPFLSSLEEPLTRLRDT
jgi:uncharacterized protein (DUF1330 family)